MTTAEQVKLVADSWAKVHAIDETWDKQGHLLFAELFTLAPEAIQLYPFKDDSGDEYKAKLSKHAIGVMKAVDSSLKLWGSPEGEKELNDLGKRHLDYSVVAAHYAILGQALLITLEKALADGFTAELKAAWTAAWEAITSNMQKGNY